MKTEKQIMKEIEEGISAKIMKNIEPKYILLGHSAYFKFKRHLVGLKNTKITTNLSFGVLDITHYVGYKIVVNQLDDRKGGQYVPEGDNVEVLG